MNIRNRLNRRPKTVKSEIYHKGQHCGDIVWVVTWKPFFSCKGKGESW